MENNINNLINNDKNTRTATTKEIGQMKHRVISMRNKLFIIGFIIIWYIIIANYILPDYRKLESHKNELINIEKQIQEFESKEKNYKEKLKLIKKINDNESTIIQCINKQENCDILPEDIKNQTDKINKFFEINNLSDSKMDINEKLILSNLNEFLIREDPLSIDDLRTNWTINTILIWDEEKFDEDFYFTPLELNITFENKDGLLSFIDNIENKISEEANNRILYQISEINYDIINNEEAQDVSFLINIFYMK